MNETLDRINTVKAMVINRLKADAEHNRDIAALKQHGECMGLLYKYCDLYGEGEISHFHHVFLRNLHSKPDGYIDNIADALNSLFKKAEIKAKEKMN